MRTLETDRLIIRKLELGDAAFMMDLLNQPSFHQFIGDRGVRTLEDARTYINDRALAAYEKNGFGPFAVELKTDGRAIGIVSLLKRDELDDVDVGFAFLPDSWRRGFASEATSAVIDFAFSDLRLGRIIAITQPGNIASIRTLEKMGLTYESTTRLAGEDIDLQVHAIERG